MSNLCEVSYASYEHPVNQDIGIQHQQQLSGGVDLAASDTSDNLANINTPNSCDNDTTSEVDSRVQEVPTDEVIVQEADIKLKEMDSVLEPIEPSNPSKIQSEENNIEECSEEGSDVKTEEELQPSTASTSCSKQELNDLDESTKSLIEEADDSKLKGLNVPIVSKSTCNTNCVEPSDDTESLKSLENNNIELSNDLDALCEKFIKSAGGKIDSLDLCNSNGENCIDMYHINEELTNLRISPNELINISGRSEELDDSFISVGQEPFVMPGTDETSHHFLNQSNNGNEESFTSVRSNNLTLTELGDRYSTLDNSDENDRITNTTLTEKDGEIDISSDSVLSTTTDDNKVTVADADSTTLLNSDYNDNSDLNLLADSILQQEGKDPLLPSTVSEQGLSPDSDSNMMTASEGFTTPSASPSSIASSKSPEHSIIFNSKQETDLDPQGISTSETLPSCDDSDTQNIDDIITAVNSFTSQNQTRIPHNSCVCNKRNEAAAAEEDNNSAAISEAWSELRSSLRQLHRAMIPSSSQSNNISSRSKPSVNKIKALANMLVYHDAHQLYLRVSQLIHELCIELKVRLLSTIVDVPTPDQAAAFVQSICESYQWVMNIYEVVQPALERLDSDHLNRFGLNLVTVNMHTFHETILIDPDIRDYLNVCVEKGESAVGGVDIMGCLVSLRRNLGISEEVWGRAEKHVQEYAMERAAITARHRQLMADWEQFKAQQRSQQLKNEVMLTNRKNGLESKAGNLEMSTTCECHFCNTSFAITDSLRSGYITNNSQGNASSTMLGSSTTSKVPPSMRLPCINSSSVSTPQASLTSAAVSSSSGGVVSNTIGSGGCVGSGAGAGSQHHHLSLYPHIHNTPAGSDIVVSNQERDDLATRVPPAKPPIFSNPYLGSDLLTEQLVREWDLVYGDTTMTASNPLTSSLDALDPSSLVNGLENLHVGPMQASFSHQMLDHSIPYTHIAACTHTSLSLGPMVSTTQSSSNSSSMSSLSSGSPPLQPTASNPLPTSLPSNLPNSNNQGSTVNSLAACSNSIAQSNIVNKSCCASSANLITQGNLHPTVERPAHKHAGHSETSCGSQAAGIGAPHTSVITHTRKYSTNTNSSCSGSKQDVNDGKRIVQRIERSTSRESPGESELSDHDEWSSGDESDVSTTASSSHQDPHCDCCVCHMIHQNQGGGRQKYSDRRDRLLQILNKKKARLSSTHSSSTTTLTSSSNCSQDYTIATQNIDKIIDYIEGHRVDKVKNAKKAAKKARQKQRKMASSRCCGKDDDDDDDYDDEYEEMDDNDDMDDNDHEDGYQEEDDEDDDDETGPLAELRRRAPDVTITLVRPGQGQDGSGSDTPPRRALTNNKGQMNHQHLQTSQPSAGSSTGKYVSSLAQGPSVEPPPPANSRPLLHATRPSQNRQPSIPVVRAQHPLASGSIGSPSPLPSQDTMKDANLNNTSNGLSNLLKGMETLGNSDKDKGSQMVTIRRVMDPSSAEPTVTITLKGEQPEKDKVLFKLVNGQAVPGSQDQNGSKKNSGKQPSAPKINYPPLEIPEGLTSEEVKKLKKKNKKDRQKQRKQAEKKTEEQEVQIQHLKLQKQQELLMLQQQVEQIEKQKHALQCQQEALIRQQQQQQTVVATSSTNSSTNSSNNNDTSNKKGKKGKGKNDNKSGNKNVSAVVYDGDDMAKNFNLPPGVSINRVAGQPGMVTISNNIGAGFNQPFLSNPNLYSAPLPNSMPIPKTVQTPNFSSLCGGIGQGLQWTGTSDKCSSYPSQDNVIVVDTNNGNSKTHNNSNNRVSSNSNNKKEMTSDEKVQAAVDGAIDPSSLNKTQKKKFKKMKKAIQEEKEKAILKQKEEDDLMDQVYMLSRIDRSKSNSDNKASKGNNNNKKTQAKQKENSKSVPQTTTGAVSNSSKQTQNKNLKSQNKQTDISQIKSKQTQDFTKQNGVKPNSGGKPNTSNNSNNKTQDKKVNSYNSNNNNQSNKNQVPTKNQPNTRPQNPTTSNRPSQQLPRNSNQQTKSQISTGVKTDVHANKQKSVPLRKHNSDSSSHLHPNKHNQQNIPITQRYTQNKSAHVNQGLNGSLPNKQSYGQSIGFASDKAGHEARYAQYLAANANTLATVNKNASTTGNCSNEDAKQNILNKKAKNKKRGKKGVMEDLNTIDSVFTPKDIADGELDETERDVEAFKRFCSNNVPRNSGEKPKVIFNIKDIMIKKKPCNGNL